MNDDELKFVARHYEQGTLDPEKAYRSFTDLTGYRAQRPIYRWLAAAAVALLLVGVGTLYLLHEPTTTLAADATQRTFRLDDGTEVVLAPHASLSYEGTYSRKVSVSGRAYLKIRHDASRPFTIEGSGYLVRDIGTQIEIDADDASTDVYVAQGSIYFASPRSAKQGVVMQEGSRAVLEAEAVRPRMLAQPSPNRVAWATHQFRFHNAALPDVLRDLSAYYHVRLTCTDTDKRLTGNFNTDSLSTIVNVIEHTLDVDIQP